MTYLETKKGRINLLNKLIELGFVDDVKRIFETDSLGDFQNGKSFTC